MTQISLARLPLAMEWTWLLLGTACAACAAAAGLGARRPRLPAGALRAAGLGLPPLIAAYKLSQFRSFDLMWDSGVSVNLAWNILHGYGIHSSVIGDASYLAVHFAFAIGWLSPLLLIWNSAGMLAMAQGALVGSTVAAIFLIAREILADDAFAALLAVLAVSTPFFHDLTFCVLDSSVLAFPFFLWGLYAWLTGRRCAAAALALMLTTTREQVPFLIFGAGLYLWAAKHRRREAAALMAFSALLFAVELALIHRAQAAWTDPANYWLNFASLGGTRDAVLRTALTRPWMFPAALAWPPAKLLTPGAVLLSFAGLPLLAGAALIPAAVVWLPNQLSDAGAFHDLHSHTCAYVFGPLVWASAVGLRRIMNRGPLARRRVAAAMLAVAAAGFLRTARFRHPPGMNPSYWPEAGPRALAFIPENASVWCDEFFLPHLATRRYVKTLLREENVYFAPRLFAPDRVLMSAHWARLAKPAVSGPVLAFLRERKYEVIFAEKDLVVFANPATLGREGRTPEPVQPAQ